MKCRKTHKVRERALLHGFSCYEISQKTSQPLSNPVSRSTSEWTAFHSKSPAEWLGISHTAPSFLLSAKSHARLAVATNFLRICALRRWRFILSHPYNKKSIVRVSVRCSFLSPLPGNSNPSGSECRPADQQREGDCCTMYKYTQRLRKSVVSCLKDAKCGPQFMCSPA